MMEVFLSASVHQHLLIPKMTYDVFAGLFEPLFLADVLQQQQQQRWKAQLGDPGTVPSILNLPLPLFFFSTTDNCFSTHCPSALGLFHSFVLCLNWD
jgi:hypothetical protein